jgi:hypothetical protein
MKKLCSIFLVFIALLSLSLLSGCAGPSSVTYSTGNGWFETSSETVEYDGKGGARVVAEDGLPLEDASGFKEEENLINYGLGREYGLEESQGLMP